MPFRRFALSFCVWLASTVALFAQLRVTPISQFSGTLSVSSGLMSFRVYNGAAEITKTVDAYFEYNIKPGCGQPISHSISYPFGASNTNPIRVTISSLTIGDYTYRIRVVSGATTIYTPWYRLKIVKSDNALPVVTVSRTLVDTIRKADKEYISELKLNGQATDDCTDTLTISWTKTSGPSAIMDDDFKGNLTLNDLSEGEYIFALVAEDDRGGVSRAEVKVIVRPPPLPPPPPVLTYMKAFSPNDDTIDDHWKIEGITATVDIAEVTVMNQFGQRIEALRPPFINDEVWDGTQFGKPMPEGAYYYIVKDKTNQEVKRGSVLLVR